MYLIYQKDLTDSFIHSSQFVQYVTLLPVKFHKREYNISLPAAFAPLQLLKKEKGVNNIENLTQSKLSELSLLGSDTVRGGFHLKINLNSLDANKPFNHRNWDVELSPIEKGGGLVLIKYIFKPYKVHFDIRKYYKSKASLST